MTDQAKYYVFGDYGYEREAMLFVSPSRRDAIRWAEYYARDGYIDPYRVIEVASFTADDEYVTHWVRKNEEAIFYFLGG